MGRVRVIVVGAGVIGLSCAVRLAEGGHEVDVFARDLPLETTSAVAAALWYPYRAAPAERVNRWAGETYRWLVELAGNDPAAGVTLRWGNEVRRTPSKDPPWRDAVPAFSRLAPADRPPGYADGWRMPVPVADTSRHLPWLATRLAAAGGTLTRAALPALPSDAPVVVNAAGLAARALAGDPSVLPVRGQVVLVEQTGVEEWLLDQSDPGRPVYVIPRADDVVVGGTAHEGVWDRTPDPDTARDIMDRAAPLVPRIAGARVLGTRVGLRPTRPTVRLETEWRAGRPVVHCYGHGGAGVTLAWGCAGDVVAEVARLAT